MGLYDHYNHDARPYRDDIAPSLGRFDHSTTPIYGHHVLSLWKKSKKKASLDSDLETNWLIGLLNLVREGKLAVDTFLGNQAEAYWSKTSDSIKELGRLEIALKSEKDKGTREFLETIIRVTLDNIRHYADESKSYQEARHYFVREFF